MLLMMGTLWLEVLRRKDMNPVVEKILAEALQTSPEDRARIAERLMASLEGKSGSALKY